MYHANRRFNNGEIEKVKRDIAIKDGIPSLFFPQFAIPIMVGSYPGTEYSDEINESITEPWTQRRGAHHPGNSGARLQNRSAALRRTRKCSRRKHHYRCTAVRVQRFYHDKALRFLWAYPSGYLSRRGPGYLWLHRPWGAPYDRFKSGRNNTVHREWDPLQRLRTNLQALLRQRYLYGL